MIPLFEDFLYPFLVVLKDGETTTKEMEKKMIKHFHLSSEDCALRTKGDNKTQLSDRIGWCRQYFRRALFIDIPKRGTYKITARGLDYLSKKSSLKIVDLLEYKEFFEYANRGKKKTKGSTEIVASISSGKTPTQVLEDAYETIYNTLVDELLDRVVSADWKFFERLVVDLLVGMGYGGSFKEAAMVTKPSKDGGIDGIIKEDKLGLDNIYVQAKKWAFDNKVSEPELTKFAGALDVRKASKGVFITTSDFTKGAYEYVDMSPKKIVLINGKELARYMIEYNVGVSAEKKYVVKRVDSDYFDED